VDLASDPGWIGVFHPDRHGQDLVAQSLSLALARLDFEPIREEFPMFRMDQRLDESQSGVRWITGGRSVTGSRRVRVVLQPET
jgi:hypothetical protein